MLIRSLLERMLSCATKTKSKPRPLPLNTVELLKIASKKFGISPHETMRSAEKLYISGYISYPRTESSKYPENFDLKAALASIKNGDFVEEVTDLLSNGFQKPTRGHDAGDHPPITPTGILDKNFDSGSSILYDYILKHFLASLSQDCKYLKLVADFEIASELFRYDAKVVTQPGFTKFMSWMAPTADKTIPQVDELKNSNVFFFSHLHFSFQNISLSRITVLQFY